MDIDNSNASKSTEEDFLSDKVFFSTHTFLQWCVLDCSYFLVPKSSMFSAAFLVTLFFLVLQVEKLKELSKLPDIYDRLTRSLAPNIWELDDVKRGLLCQVTSWNIKMFF